MHETNYPQLRRMLFLTVALFIFSTALRGVFYYAFHGIGGVFSSQELKQALLMGARFDLRLSLIFSVPLALFAHIPKFNPDRSVSARTFWYWFYLSISCFLIQVYFFDIGHFAYLQSRINVTILLFLQNPLISAQMMWESYNLVGIFILFVIVMIALHLFLKKCVFISTTTLKKNGLKTKVIQTVLVAVLYFIGLYGNLGQYPLRWSDAFFSNNGFITALAMNPVHYFFDTFENPEKDYDETRARSYYDIMAKYLGVENLNSAQLNYGRPIPQTPQFKSRPNIVYIVMESMAAYKTGLFGNVKNASPALDRLANEGWLFTNFYTPTEGTARSLFCVLTGLPDINAKSTSSRNPLIINQNSVFNSFKNYEKMYFIGGSAAWGNIRGIYKNNIPRLQLYEEDNLQGPRSDVWGLSDLDLFREAARILKKSGDQERTEKMPFVAVIQTAGFHRPYTIPPEHGDFKLEQLSPEDLKKYGWVSNEEYNSLRFQDYSLGEFIRLASKEKYFANTIFVIHGDHGLPNRGASHISEGYRRLELNRFHVPLVIYSPLIQKPMRNEQMATEMDVMPTMAGLTGHAFTNTSLGRNLFALDPKAPNYAWSYVYYGNPLELFLYDDQYIVRGTPEGAQNMYLYKSDRSAEDVKDKYPEKFKEMSDLLLGFYETGKWMIFHNKAPAENAL